MKTINQKNGSSQVYTDVGKQAMINVSYVIRQKNAIVIGLKTNNVCHQVFEKRNQLRSEIKGNFAVGPTLYSCIGRKE